MHFRHDRYGGLPPPYTTDDDGNRLHSWRTLVLEYLRDTGVDHKSIALDQAWDAEANAAFRSLNLAIFKSPRGANQASNYTHFVAVVGDDTCFPPNSPRRLRDISDGPARTVLLLECPESQIEWFEPNDASVDEAIDIVRGSKRHGGVYASFADGSVHLLRHSSPEATLRKLFNGSDGTATDW